MNTLDGREHQLAELTQNIPGGIHQCADDANLTLLSMSKGFLDMFGYTREEIKNLFDNKFINMIYPGDRQGVLSCIGKQGEQGLDLELEYRVRCKDGQLVWVLDKGRRTYSSLGKHSFYCLLIEINARKSQEEELRLSLERHQLIMDQATDIIFEWDIACDKLSFSSNWLKKFQYYPIDTSISDKIPLSKNIYPDDMCAFIKIMRDTAAGVPYSEAEFRIKDITGRYFWCRIRATTQYDSEGHPIKAVGVIVDIDAEKKQKQALLEQVQLDALTGLYNKAAIGALVKERMNDGQPELLQAMLLIDIDHFKAVNDTFGHLCGDFLLSNVAAALKSSTSPSDLVGRIGGDEFLVYLSHVADEEEAKRNAEKILASVQSIIPEKGSAPISCSIGVAVLPFGTIDYLSLYKCADQALYRRKNSGRGGFSFFRPDMDLEDTLCGLSESAVSGIIVSEEENVIDEGLAQYVFRTLYEAADTEATIDRLLEIIGRSFDVSRAYIFESSDDGLRCSNTFEWCAEGVAPQKEFLQNIAYKDELGDYLRNFDGNGVFYCRDVEKLHPDVRAVLEPQGIRSMLQCAILDEGEFKGYIGFDECREYRSFSSRQEGVFKLTADVLSIFLVKCRQKERIGRLRESLLTGIEK